MSARIKKDLKNLTPEWSLGILLACAPLLIANFTGISAREFLPGHFAFLAICSAWIGAAILGKDLSMGALSFSFAQLESRETLWKEKLQTLGIMSLGIYLASLIVMGFSVEPINARYHLNGVSTLNLGLLAFVGLVITLATLGGGLFFSLTLRSYQGAFWLALLTPVAITVVLTFPLLISSIPAIPSSYWKVVAGLTLAYGLILGGLAYRRFVRWEDLGTLGGDVWLTFEGSKQARTKKRAYRPIIGLIKKELCLQQMNLLICLSILALYALAVPFYDHQSQSTEIAALLAYFARLVLLVFLPLAIGASSIAEERRLGINEWQATLPGKISAQWLTKLLTAYGLTLLATTLAPMAIDLLYTEFWSRLPVPRFASLTVTIGVPLLATSLGFYASSMSRSFLVSLGSSFVSLIVFGLLLYLTSRLLSASVTLEGPALPQFLLAAVSLVLGVPLLWGLSFHNFRTHQSLPARLPLNLAAWIACLSLAGVLSNLIYSRAWERFASSEPAPKASAIKEGVVPAVILGTWTAVLAPNGTLWASRNQVISNTQLATEERMTQIGTDADWIQAFSSLRNAYLLKRDGSLYRAPKWGRNSMKPIEISNPRPEASWTKVMAGNGASSVIGMKADGSLWEWKENDDTSLSEVTPFMAERQWSSVARAGHFFVGVATDRTLWGWGHGHASQANAFSNPVIESILEEARILFPDDEPPNMDSPDVRALLEKTAPLLEEHGLDVMNMADRTAAATYINARFEQMNVFRSPHPISSDPVWNSVRFTNYLPAFDGKRMYAAGVLIATQEDDTTWTSSDAAKLYWDIIPETPEAKFAQVPSNKIPQLLQYEFDGREDSLLLINNQGSMRERRFQQNHREKMSLINGLDQRAARNDWVSFYQDGYSIIALTADGLLWHAGPYPIDRPPSNALALLIPSSRKLRPVFDLINGEAL